MNEDTFTKRESQVVADNSTPVPVLLLAYTPMDNEDSEDRWALDGELSVGRKRPATLRVDDGYLSKPHFRIFPREDAYYLEDLGSTNGTFINGMPLVGRQKLRDADVVRAGRSIFVFHSDGESLLEPCPPDIHGIGGRFHVASQLEEINRFSGPHRHVLLTGPTGTGKELAAQALAKMSGRDIVVYNAARLKSDGAAEAALFGVGRKVFTDVQPSTGLIELADGKALFLDEAHALPQSVQRMILRVMEDWHLSKVGEHESKEVDVKFIMASNLSSRYYGIESDLLSRMRVLKIGSLKERAADIPSIFQYILRSRLLEFRIDADEVFKIIHANIFECLCLDGFEDSNVRGLKKIADEIAFELERGKTPDKVIKQILNKRYRKDIVFSRVQKESKKEEEIMHKFNLDRETLALIKDACYAQKGVVIKIVEALRKQGVNTSHRRITNILNALGVRRPKKRS